MLRNSSVCLGCFDTTETNPNFLFLVSRNKPKQMRNRSCFGLFRFEPKIIFVCFEDTLVRTVDPHGENGSNPLLTLTLTTITSVLIQNKQASTPHHVHSTMQPPSKITVCKMYSCQYQPVKIINQKEWHMPPNI